MASDGFIVAGNLGNSRLETLVIKVISGAVMSDTSIWLISRKVMKSILSLSYFIISFIFHVLNILLLGVARCSYDSFPGRLDMEVSVEW